MPAFTAVASYLVAEIGGIALAAAVGSAGITLITSVVATGLAVLTSRIINGGGSSGSGGTQQDPGVRIQLPPATDNKVPVIYGTANTKGICTDARISDDNQQMTYVLVLSEKTQTGTFTVGDIYWNDQLLQFDTGANNYKVASSIDQNGKGTTNTNFAGLIEMRVYAGSATTATSQIFPATNTVAAATYIGESTSTYLLNDLVYAVVKLTYSSEKSVTSLAQMTFEVTNSLSNPGLVLYDYLTAERYGAAIASSEIDITSLTSTASNTSLYSISNEIPPNQFESDGTTTSTQARYVANGVLSTGETVKNNLEKITQACASWLTYDFVQGKWTVVVNRALSSGELAALTVYDDDLILGDVSVNATNLEDLYNGIQVEFPSREIRDQNDYYRASIDVSERNDLEPDNVLNLRYDLINNAIHAQRLGLIELKQSRVDKTIQFKTTYEGLQTKAGDVIKVTNEVYGFTEKLFRVTRVREVEDDAGGISCEITALEYSADIFSDTSITDYQANQATGIPSFDGPTALPAPGNVVIGSTFATNNQPYFQISSQISATSGPVDQIQWYYQTGSNYVYITNEVGPFTAGQTVSDSIYGLSSGVYNIVARSIKDNGASSYSSVGGSSTINWNPQPGGVNNGNISTSTFSSQVQIVNTTSGSLKIPLVATTSGYQPVYADTELSYDASSNVLSVGGLAVSTGTVVQKVITSGGYPVNSAGTATVVVGLNNSYYPTLVASNYTSGLTPSIYVRAYGQNRPAGTATTNPNPNIILEAARGTSASPTAVQLNDTIGVIAAGGYDGANWPLDYASNSYNVAGWYASENMTFSGTATLQAGTGYQIYVQPQWTKPWANGALSRQRILFTNWTSTSSTGPSVINIGIGSGIDGTAPAIVMVDGTTYTGYGSANFIPTNTKTYFIGVPSQDTAPDNVTLTGTNIVSIVGGRRSGASGRRNALQAGDTVGAYGFAGQTTTGATGFGSSVGNLGMNALDNFSSTTRGTRAILQTVNTGTTTLSNRLSLDDRSNAYASDAHVFYDKSSTFQSVSLTTSTATFTAIPIMPIYTKAQAGALTGRVGAIICISDSLQGSNPNGMMAFWDTSNTRWSYVHDNSAV